MHPWYFQSIVTSRIISFPRLTWIQSWYRTDGTAARERYAKYGGGLFPVAWYDLQRFWASHLPPGALQIGSLFDRYEDLEEGGVIVHLKVTSLRRHTRSMHFEEHLHLRCIDDLVWSPKRWRIS